MGPIAKHRRHFYDFIPYKWFTVYFVLIYRFILFFFDTTKNLFELIVYLSCFLYADAAAYFVLLISIV